MSVLARVASAQAQEGVLGPGLADWTSSGKRSCLRASMLNFRMKTTWNVRITCADSSCF